MEYTDVYLSQVYEREVGHRVTYSVAKKSTIGMRVFRPGVARYTLIDPGQSCTFEVRIVNADDPEGAGIDDFAMWKEVTESTYSLPISEARPEDDAVVEQLVKREA